MSWNRGKGRGIKFLRDHLHYRGRGCLIWPMSRDTRGYPLMGLNGKTRRAVRVMCEMVNGPAPIPKHEAAHSCGNGHLGCIHPRHLSWKTTSGNQQDSIAHGTFARARGGQPRFKLTADQVKEIRVMKDRPSHEKIGAMYGVSSDTIGKLLRGETWKTGKRAIGGFQSQPWTAERRAQYRL
jgi:hypothetical protein